MDRPEYFKDDVRTASQMSYGELESYIDGLQKKHFDVTPLTLDLYRKLSYPLVSFIMVLLGIPFSFKTGRKGAFWALVLAGMWMTLRYEGSWESRGNNSPGTGGVARSDGVVDGSNISAKPSRPYYHPGLRPPLL
jgi:lipopolysaccharide export LptBFGC system permease protein LptF